MLTRLHAAAERAVIVVALHPIVSFEDEQIVASADDRDGNDADAVGRHREDLYVRGRDCHTPSMRTPLATAVFTCVLISSVSFAQTTAPLKDATFLVTPSASWSLTWSDEFDGTALDTAKWTLNLPWPGTDGTHRHHNDLYAGYIQDDDVKVADGSLQLSTQMRDVKDANGKLYHYTQAMVTTSGKFEQTYGYFEVRVKLPAEAGPGLWPAFWTLSNGWPPEMDICEVWTSTNRSHQGLAYRNKDGKVAWDDTNESRPLPSGWTTYGMEWGPGYQVYNVDGRVTKRVFGEWTTDVPHYLLLNSGVAADLPPTNATVFPNTFFVDYVRVYARKSTAAVLNGDFEIDSLWPWTRYGNVSLVDYAKLQGKQSLRVDGPNSAAEQQMYGLKPHAKYALSATVRAGVGGADLRLGVKNFGGAGECYVIAGATTPTTPKVIFETGDSTTATIYCYAPDEKSWGYFDDVKLEEANQK